ncbi:unnamed protein product [Ceratitis capitata]|uniref:(Mediterranean fruit fly) hypothetical protein n=1 Tax=Ceratitis capitata TaxID=7213 RepID=A0A811U025_CERCA|nr:unnamed protein product [Ceratitis capitata]
MYVCMYLNHFSVLPINRIEIFSIYYFCCLQLTSRPRQLSSTPAAGSLLAAGHTQPQSAVRRHRYSTAQCVRRNGGDVGGGGGGGGGEVHFKRRRIGVGRGGGCCGLSQIVVHCSEKKVVCVVVCRSLSHFKLNEIIFVFAFAFAF